MESRENDLQPLDSVQESMLKISNVQIWYSSFKASFADLRNGKLSSDWSSMHENPCKEVLET